MAKNSLGAVYYNEEAKLWLAYIAKGFDGKRLMYRDSSL